jgi:hypothetical protein
MKVGRIYSAWFSIYHPGIDLSVPGLEDVSMLEMLSSSSTS